MPCLITLSQKELHRLEAIQKIRDHRLSVVQTADVLHLSRSQVHRLLRAYEHDGTVGIASRKRGRPRNRRYDEAFRNTALDLVRERYRDFGPTLAMQKLNECHDNVDAAEFAADFNVRFGKEPRNPKDMHRPLAAHENLDAAMCRKEVRTLSRALTLQYDKVLFILDPSELAKSLAGKKVIVCDFPDGRLEIMEGSTCLPYRLFDKLRSVHRTPIA
jgi:predicted ArsR family transcriptional regulator